MVPRKQTKPAEAITQTTSSATVRSRTNASRTLAEIAILSAIIAFGTTVLRIPLPPPIFEITAAPAFYLAISVLYSRKVSFWSTVIGSAIGEAINITLSAGFLIYVPGMVWARAPEALIVAKFRNRSYPVIIIFMIVATVYETLAFLVPDTLFYAYALFSYTDSPLGLAGGFTAAFTDIFTLVDLVWIPVAILIIIGARKAFHRRFLDE